MVNENGDFLIAFFLIIAYNINEQENLLDLSALQLKMRIVNFREIRLLISLFCYTMEEKIWIFIV